MNEIPSTTNSIVTEFFTIGTPATETATTYTPTYYSPIYTVISSDSYQQSTTAVWGDGLLETSAGEKWDDKNILSDDGWSSTCKVESGFGWNQDQTTNISICTKVWGNGMVDSSEQWDDGNIIKEDGCNENCQVETGYEWSTLISKGNISYCSKICGNGKID